MSIDKVRLFQRIEARARKELVPKLRVIPKRASWLHRTINRMLNCVYRASQKNSYRDRYSTTLGYSVAMAERYGHDPKQFAAWETLCHEVQHAVQAKKLTRPLFGFLYLWPLSQGLLLLLLSWLPVFWAEGWQLALWIGGWVTVAGLHFIPQLPDPLRTRWELEAYTVSMHMYALDRNAVSYAYIQHLAKQFYSMAYYIMEPRRKKILDELTTRFARIQTGRSAVRHLPIVKIAEEEYQKCLTEVT